MSDLPKSATGKEIRFSPTSSSAYRGCPRWWWYKYVYGVKEPVKDHLTFGSSVHLVCEIYLKTGNTIVPGSYEDGRDTLDIRQEHIDRAVQSFKHLPPPRTGKVEVFAPQINIYEGPEGRIRFAGKLDWFGIYPEIDTDHHMAPDGFDGLWILDHKTKSNFDGRYGVPTAEKLAQDAQGLSYAHVLTSPAIEDNPFVGTDVLFTHNYIQSRSALRTQRVDTLFARDAIVLQRKIDRDIGQAMVIAARETSPEGVEANTSYCRRFGGICPAAQFCTAREKPKFFDAISSFDSQGGNMGFWDKMGTTPDKAKATLENAPTPETKVQSPDMHPHDEDTVTPAFIRDVVTDVEAQFRGCEFAVPFEDIMPILAQKGLSMDWLGNVAMLAEDVPMAFPESIDVNEALALTEDQLLTSPLEILLAAMDDTQTEGDRAKELLSLPMGAFRAACQQAPFRVLLNAMRIAEGAKATALGEILDQQDMRTPIDDMDLDDAWRIGMKRVLFLKLGGEPITDEVLKRELKESGAVGRLGKKLKEKALDILGQCADFQMGDTVAAPVEDTVSLSEVKDYDEALELLKGKLDGESYLNFSSLLERRIAAESAADSGDDAEVTDLKAKLEATQRNAAKAREDAKSLRAEVSRLEQEMATATPVQTKGTTLYVGCIDRGGKIQSIERYLDTLAPKVLEKVRMHPDDANCQHWREAGYGRGTSAFTNLLQRTIANTGLPEGEFYLPARTQYDALPIVECFAGAGARLITHCPW